MSLRRSEQYAVGNDAGTTSAYLKRAHKLGKKQQLGLAGIGIGKDFLVHIALVEAASKWRVCHDERVASLVVVLLRERVAPSQFGCSNVVEQEVHGSYAQHGLVGIVAVNHRGLHVLHLLTYIHGSLILLLDILHRLNQESCRTHGRVADVVLGRRLHHLYNHAYDVARRAKLSVGARCSHLAEYILVDIAHGVAVVHVECVHTVNHFGKRTGVGYEEYSRLHVAAVGTLLTGTDMLDKLKHTLAHNLEHVVGTEVLEHVPTQILVRHAGTLLVAHGIGINPQLAVKECGVLHFAVPVACVLFFLQLLVVEQFHKEDVGHLLQYCDGIGDASHKECVPYLVYLVFYFASYHRVFSIVIVICSQAPSSGTWAYSPLSTQPLLRVFRL